MTTESGILSATAQIACAYLGANKLEARALPELIGAIAGSLRAIGLVPEVQPAANTATPAQVRKSITHEALISFEDSKPYRTLKRHLSNCGLTPQEYRVKWGLPGDYPMVCAGYSAVRAAFARKIGLGKNGRMRAKAAPLPEARPKTPKANATSARGKSQPAARKSVKAK